MESRCPECGMTRPGHTDWCPIAESSPSVSQRDTPALRRSRRASRRPKVEAGDKALLGALLFLLLVLVVVAITAELGDGTLNGAQILGLLISLLGILILGPVALVRVVLVWRKRGFWPGPSPTSDLDAAASFSNYGAGAAFVMAGLGAVGLVALPALGARLDAADTLGAMIFILIYVILGVGILRRYPFAAIAAVILFAIDMLGKFLTLGTGVMLAMPILGPVGMFLFMGARATIAHRNLSAAQSKSPEDPT